MSYAPIALFVYNRDDHFRQTVKALSECPEAAESELYIFSDGAKNEAAVSQVEAVRKTAGTIKENAVFKNVTIVESHENKGLAASIINGVTEVMEKHGKAIVLEDDCVASPYLLGYMNKCLDYFENDRQIGSIAGYSPPIVFPEDYDTDIYTAVRSCSWGWASWLDRWDGVDWDLNDISELYRDPKLVKKLNSNGSDRFIRLYRQTISNKNSWSVKFGYHLVKNGMLTIYPRFSYIDNIGCDSTGVHSKIGDKEKTKIDLSKAIAEPKIENVEPDERIQKAMKKFYSGGMISDIKRAIATKAIIMKEKSRR